MKPFEFAEYPRSTTVSSLVTAVVAGWFVLASGAILSDRHSEGTLEMARTPSMASSTTPDAHFSIVVTAKRSAAS